MPLSARSFRALIVLYSLVAAAGSATGQQTPPGIYISPPGGATGESAPTVTIIWTHSDLQGGTRVIEVTKDGATTNVTSSFSYQVEMTDPVTTGVLMARSVGTVALSTATVTRVRAYVCGGTGSAVCGEETAEYTYTPPPPPAQRADPAVSFTPHASSRVNLTRDVSTAFYATPSYVSLGAERSLGFFYSNELANPRPLIRMDVTDHSLSPAERFSVRVRNLAGSLLTLTNGQTTSWYSNTGGATGDTVRLGLQLPANMFATGVHEVIVEVTSHWSDPVETRTRTETVPVLVVNLRDGAYGPGWWVQGLQRAYVVADGILLHDGSGTALHFRGSAPTYTAPTGERSTLHRVAGDSIQRRYPDGTVAMFEPGGLLVYVRSHLGDEVRYGYTGGRLSSVTDPAGLQTTLGYTTFSGAGTYLTSVTTPGGRSTTVTHGSSFTVQDFIDPDGVRALRQYRNTAAVMDSLVDRSGGKWWFSVRTMTGTLYNVRAPWITVNGAPARPWTRYFPERLLYVPDWGAGTLSAPLARVRSRDVFDRMLGERGEETRVWSDRHGLPTKIVGPLGHTTTIERDTAGYPTLISEPRGTQRLMSWHDDGTVESTFDQGHGEGSNIEYGTFGGVRLPIRIVQGGVETRLVRGSSLGEVRSVVVQGDTMVWYTYDSRYRVLTTRGRDGREAHSFYDGTVWKNADSARVVSASGTQTTSFTFDAFGRTKTVRDPSGRITTDSLDLVGRLLKRRAPGDSVLFTYDSVGLRRVTDAVGKEFEFRRNRLGWVNEAVDPNGRSSYVGYDSAGNAVSRTDRQGRTFTYAYDLLGRITSATAPGIQTPTTYAYDNPYGNYFVVANGESRDSVSYTPAGQVHSTVTTMGGQTFRIGNTYGDAGLRTFRQLTSPAAGTASWETTVHYGYDGRPRLTWITDAPGNTTTSVAYDTPGRLQKLTYPGTLGTLDLTYDPRSQLSSYAYSRSNLHGEFGSALSYDVLGRRTGRSWQSGWRQRVHSFDGPGRMTAYSDQRWSYMPPPPFCDGNVTDPICDGSYDWAPVGSGSYAYDAVGNRTSWSVADSLGATVYASASLQATSNRYASFDGWTMTYDTVGNLVRRQKGSADVQYQWNSLGQLTGVYTPASGWVYYGYNGFGMRVRRTQGSVVQRYLYDGAELAAEVNGSGSPLRTYTHFPGIDQPHSMRSWSGTTPGAVHYYALDLPGNNVNGLFDASGTITHRYRYSPWGEAQVTSETTHNPLRFASRELDAATGLYFNRARWYDPYLGRFLSEDPIGIAGGINVYAYAGNDPVNYTDPWGLSPCTSGYVCLPGVTVVARPNNPWDTDPWNGVGDRGRGPRSIGGGRDGTWQDDGSDHFITEPLEESGPLMCYAAIAMATEAASSRRIKAERFQHAESRYRDAARIRDQTRPLPPGVSTVRDEEYWWAVQKRYYDARRERDWARRELNNANIYMGGTMAVVIAACATAATPTP